MKKQISLFAASVFFSAQLFAQQTPYVNFFQTSWQMVNPAALDRIQFTQAPPGESRDDYFDLVLRIGSRIQGIGLEGAPQTHFVSIEWAPERKEKNAPGRRFGAVLMEDRTDAISNTSLMANYLYYFLIPGTKGHVLHLGLGAKINQYRIDIDRLRFRDQDDPTMAAISANPNFMYADFSLGFVYRVKQSFYIGGSAPSTFSLNFESEQEAYNLRTQIRRHLFLMTGGFIPFGKWDPESKRMPLMLEPSLWMRSVPSVYYDTPLGSLPVSFDANLRLHMFQRYWAGLGYGSNRLVQAEFAFVINRKDYYNDAGNRWQLGLSYGFPVGDKSFRLGSAIELNLLYWWGQ